MLAAMMTVNPAWQANAAFVGTAAPAPLLHAAVAAQRMPQMVAAEPSATVPVPGAGASGDDDAFRANPEEFCSERSRKYGSIFATGIAGGTVLVGDSTALNALDSSGAESASSGPSSSELAAPFARAGAAEDPFEPYAEAFSKTCYDTIFQWIPRYKEAGFSTFRFEDFIDGRVRRLVPSLRTLVLRAAAPCLFGVSSYDQLPPLLGFENAKALEAAYAAHATTLRGPAKFGLPSMPSLFDLEGGGGDAKALEAGLAQWARSQQQGGGDSGGALGASAAAGASSGASLLWELGSSVEQTTALCATMLMAAHSKRGPHAECCDALVAEQAAALKGSKPDCAITGEILGRMPQLEAFARECLRLYPPSRPGSMRLPPGTSLPVSGGAAMGLPASGAVVRAEPFVGHMQCDDPAKFNPARHLAGEGSAPPLTPFGTSVAGDAAKPASLLYAGVTDSAPGAAISVSMAKAVYVQLSRMFEEILIGAEPPPVPSGTPVHMVGEKVEVLLKPKMFYELQRGVKKLRF